MTRSGWIAILLLTGGGAALGIHAQDPKQETIQTFRTGTDVVLVDVSVRADGRPVAGLGADDFVLTDNGIRQRIDSVEKTAVPIDLTLVVDVSGNAGGRLTPRISAGGVETDLKAELSPVMSVLRPEDRVRVLAIDRHVQLVSALSPAGSPLNIRALDVDGIPALYDSLAAALLHPSEPARRHVVIARTKGQDTISAIDAQAVREIAERSDALFHLVLMESALDNDDAISGFQCQVLGFCWPARRFWVPFRRRLVGGYPVHPLMPDGMTLAAGAEATGGGLHKTGALSVPTLAGTFARTFEDFRSGYLLRYTPQGVARSGWHEIAVKIPASRGYTVRSRRGYSVEEERTVTLSLATPNVPRTLGDFISAYDRDAYRQVAAGLGQLKDPLSLLREFEEAGNPWPAAPRREAAFVLELADPGVFSTDRDTRERAQALLERFTRLVRHPLEPDTFERYWHFAALTLLEGTIRPGTTTAFVERALQRFPNEPRFILTRAIVSEQHWAGVGRRSEADTEQPRDVEAVLRNYEAAATLPEVAAEAHIRIANLLHRIERYDEALDHLARAAQGPVADPHLRYLRHLVRGRVLGSLLRIDEAIAAYRGALEVVPTAQSARVGLMSTLLLRGDRAGAEALAQQVQTEGSEALDPWWVYWQGQYRLHPQAMARIRELGKGQVLIPAPPSAIEDGQR